MRASFNALAYTCNRSNFHGAAPTGARRFVVVRYEDVVLQTEQVLADIATAAGLPAEIVDAEAGIYRASRKTASRRRSCQQTEKSMFIHI